MSFTLAHAIWMLALGIGSWVAKDPRVAAMGGAASLFVLAAQSAGRWAPPGRRFGVANAITAFRVLLLMVLSTLRVSPRAAILLLALLALDGLDGAIARKRDEASEFGAQFDMEADALTVLVAGLVIMVSGTVGAFIALPGLLRYVYAIAIHVAPGSRGEAPRSKLGRRAFVVLMLSLVVCLVPVVPVDGPMAMLSTGLVSFSFLRCFHWSFGGAEGSPPRARFVENREGEEQS